MILAYITSLKKNLLFALLVGSLCSTVSIVAHQQTEAPQDITFRISPEMQKYGYWFVATWGLPATGMLSILRELNPIETAKTVYQAQENLSPELKEHIDATIEKFGIDAKTITVLTSSSPLVFVAIAVGNNVIVINEEAFKSYSYEEIEFLIGHELTHLKHKDTIKLGLVAFAAPFIAHFGLRAWDALVNKAIILVREQVKPQGHIETALTKLNDVNHWISTFCVTTCFIGWKLFNAYSRKTERDADFFAISHLKTSKGACDFFKRIQEQQKPLRETSFMHKHIIAENGDNLADKLHPLLSERIQYSQEWAELV